MRNIKKLREISARLKELGIPEETLALLNDWIREQILVNGLARMASNFGEGSFSSSPDFETQQRFRTAASGTLREAGYVYKEYPEVPPDGDGWYLPQ